MQSRRRGRFPLFPLFAAYMCFVAGCVTQTERIYPHQRIPRDETVWEELQREFGWQKQAPTYEDSQPTDPFYKRAMRGITTTVSGWFRENEIRLSEQEIVEDRRRFNRKREEALRRLQEQQELEQMSGVE